MKTAELTGNFAVNTMISADAVRNLLTSAFEGGSNYWYMITRKIVPRGIECRYLSDVPLVKGGTLVFTTEAAGDEAMLADDGKSLKVFRLNRLAIQVGLTVMAAKFPKHFADIVTEDCDQNTADVFLQCCLFGELIYG